jgi:uncharacterized circularly permuted ATP-grasp superfamily protein
LIYTYVPEFIRYYLNEDPLLDNVETYRLEDPDCRHEILEHLDRYVVKPVDGSGGKGIVIGPQSDEETLATLRTTIVDNPRGFIAQRTVSLSTVPTFVDNQMSPRHVDLRPFAISDGEEVWVLPGGLTRVALAEGALVVNSSQGGGSKDTWVLADVPRVPPERVVATAAPSISFDGDQRQQGPEPPVGSNQ